MSLKVEMVVQVSKMSDPDKKTGRYYLGLSFMGGNLNIPSEKQFAVKVGDVVKALIDFEWQSVIMFNRPQMVAVPRIVENMVTQKQG